MDRLLTLEVFAKVVERGSFVGAADALEMSPASITEHVKSLEKRLKTQLLHRTTRRIALTEEGAAYFEHCKQILAHVDEADGMLAAQRVAPKGVVRVQAPQVLASAILIPRMREFLDRYPEISVVLTIGASNPDLMQQNLDLALVIDPDPDPGVIFRPIGLCRVRTFASPAYLEKHGTPKHPDDLASHHLIGVRPGPGIVLSTFRFEKDGRMVSREFASRFIADSGAGQGNAAVAGVGIAQAFHYAVAAEFESGRLVPVLDDWSWSGPPLGAVHLPNRFVSPKVQVFVDLVKQALEGKIAPYRADWDNR